MIKTMFAFGALSLAIAVPATAQMAAGASGSLPMCSAKVHDSCQQGADDANAMSADQAMKSGGVGDRGHDDAAHMGGGMAKHKSMKMMHKPKMVSRGHNPDPTLGTKPQ